ncbi:TonB-dependent copper receptor [Pseudoalteromonas 'SMAR']|uniref:TonB-dependent copper receptor n=1 Tax=Pseudoalteromonas 'SMAR' TaxID=3416908 RepID=UPI003AF2A878
MKRTLLSLGLSATIAQPVVANDIERIVVIAPMQTPLSLQTNPKAVRQPLPAQDGADLLASIPGFALVKKGGASADPVFRGMAGSRLAIIANNGQTLGGCGSRMDPPTAYITPQSYDSLTVIKGPQTVLHGAGSSAATIIFERDKARLAKAEVEGFSNLVMSDQGRHTINSDLKFGNTQGFARIAANYSDSNDYDDGNGNPVHSAYERWNLDIELAYTPSDNAFYSISLGNSDAEVAYADRMMDGSLFDRQNIAIDVQLDNLSTTIDSLAFSAYHNEIDHIMDNFSLRPFVANKMMPTPTASNPDRTTLGAKLTLASTVSPTSTLVYGVDHQHNEHRLRKSMQALTRPVSQLPRKADATFQQLGAFMELEYQLSDNSQWVSGLRLDDWQSQDKRSAISVMMQTKPNPTAFSKRTETLFSGFTRYQAQSKHSSYFVGVGITERMPDYWELIGAARGSESSLSAFNVDIEQSKQLDVGLLHQHKQTHISVSAFYNQTDDYVLIDNNFMTMAMPRNVTRNIDAESFGMEAEVRWQLNKQLQLSSSMSYVKGNNLSDHQPLAQQPPLEVRLAANYEFNNHWQFGALLTAVKRQHRVALGQGNIAGQDIAATPGFATLALNANYQHNDDIELSFGLDNLLDKVYAQHLSRSGAAVSGYQQTSRVNEPGRTLWANLNWRF